MTDTPTHPSDADSADPVALHALPDAMLSVFVDVAQATPDYELGVTLNVAGATVTGTLVGRDAWLSQLSSAYEGKLANTLAPFVKFYAEDETPEDEVVYKHIHLTNARFLAGQGLMPNGTGEMFWRGRLAHVSGWSIGVIS